jgi:putative oxidoreductase
MTNAISDVVLVVARVFLATLFLIFGWRKVRDWPGTLAEMVDDGVPTPAFAAVIAIFMELAVASALVVGVFTRSAAALMVLYTLGTSLVEHRYWMTTGPNYVDRMESFYKNLSIMGGFMLLFITGAGKYSIDALFGIAAP